MTNAHAIKNQDYSTITSARELLGEEVVNTIQGTAPLLAEHGETITGLFYSKLFAAHPELKHVFNMANQASGQQKHALAGAVYGFATHLDDLQGFKAQINRISQKHASLSIKPEHYPIVGKYLLEAIHEAVRGLLDVATADLVVDVWGQAYEILATLLIDAEETLYDTTQKQLGGWRGTREFILADRQQESQDVVSFYFKPVDGEKIIAYDAGQYIGIHTQPDTSPHAEIRQYSLSDEWQEGQPYYRISVKRASSIKSNPEGIVSNFLHKSLKIGDSVQLTAPRGEFTLKNQANTPVILVSGGVGITPVYSMLKSLLSKKHTGPLVFVHGTENSQQHVFKENLNQLQQDSAVDSLVFYNKPLEDDRHSQDYHFKGLVDLDSVKDRVKLNGAEYYLCGPLAFMEKINHQLLQWGIDESNIHYEIFGPSRSLSAA